MIIRLLAVWFLFAVAAASMAQKQLDPQQLPQRAILTRLGEMRWRETGEIYFPAISPDGKTLAVGRVGSLGIWDMKTGTHQRYILKNGCFYFWSLAWAPDATLYAGGQDHDVMQWDTAAGKLLRTFSFHKSVVKRISLSADGKTLASADVSKKIAVWDVATGKRLLDMTHEHESNWPEVALSPDGKLLATNGMRDKPVQIRDARTGRLQHVFNDGVNTNFVRLLFTSDGKTLVGGEHGKLFFWDLATSKLRKAFKIPDEDHVEGLALSPDGKRFATVGWRERVHVWNVEAGKFIRTLIAPGDRLYGVGFGPDNKTVVAGGVSGAIYLWDADSGKLLNPSTGHSGSIEAIAWLGNDRILTAGLDKTVRLWNPNEARTEKILTLHDKFHIKRISTDGSTLIGKTEGHLHVLDAATGKEKLWIKERLDWDPPLAISPDGKLLAYPVERTRLHVRPAAPAAATRIFPGQKRMLGGLAFSPDGKTLAVGYEQLYKEPLKLNVDARRPFVFPPRRDDPTLYLYDAATGKELKRFGQELPGVSTIAFAPNGRLLAVGDTHYVHIWDVPRGRKAQGRYNHGSHPSWLAFSPDGRQLAVVARGAASTFYLYEAATMTLMARFDGHQGSVSSLAFAPDGRRLVSAATDTTAIIWDATGLATQGRFPKLALGQAEIDKCWQELCDLQAVGAYPALWKLVASGDTCLDILERNLKPVPRVEAEKVTAWMRALADAKFPVRDEAMRQLERLGDAIELELIRFLETRPDLEVRRRVERLLAKMGPTPDRLRAHRALMILEQIGSARARALLRPLAAGEPLASFTQDAAESLARLK